MSLELEPKWRSFLTKTEIVLTPSNLLLESTAEQKRTKTYKYNKVQRSTHCYKTKAYLKSVWLDSRQFWCQIQHLNRFRGFVVSTLSFGEHSRSPANKFKANKLNLMTFNFRQFVLSRGILEPRVETFNL